MTATKTTPRVYLSRQDVAQRLGMKNARSLSGIELPPPDVQVGIHPGWLAETIDAWHAERPGRGWHGGR
ncbi:MAG: hypothetical protein JO214_00635 [Frankiaceae bacterium]|nr:hypothetical protein [Frankiaceae bacterium]